MEKKKVTKKRVRVDARGLHARAHVQKIAFFSSSCYPDSFRKSPSDHESDPLEKSYHLCSKCQLFY